VTQRKPICLGKYSAIFGSFNYSATGFSLRSPHVFFIRLGTAVVVLVKHTYKKYKTTHTHAKHTHGCDLARSLCACVHTTKSKKKRISECKETEIGKREKRKAKKPKQCKLQFPQTEEKRENSTLISKILACERVCVQQQQIPIPAQGKERRREAAQSRRRKMM